METVIQAPKATCYIIPLMRSSKNQQDLGGRKAHWWLPRAEGRGQMGSDFSIGFFFEVMVVIAQHCECTKHHSVVCFKMVNFAMRI